MTVGVVTVVCRDAQQQGLNGVHLQLISTAIVLQGSTVMDNIRDFPQAVCLLFGLMYALHFDYPKKTWQRHSNSFKQSCLDWKTKLSLQNFLC